VTIVTVASGDGVDEQVESQKFCKQCYKTIPKEARLCSHCNSYQDWRSWFSISGTVLALLTALVSVLGIATPAIIKVLHTPKSNAVLQAPSLDGTMLRIVATNSGDAPASLVRARIAGDYLAGATKIRLRNDGDAIIPPGSKLLTFDIVPLLDEDQSYAGSMEALTAVVSKKPMPPTSILLEVAQSDGASAELRFDLSDDNMFSLLRNNADRCSGISEPNFMNGCIGNGAPKEARAPGRPLQPSPRPKIKAKEPAMGEL
jgi:ribosomal protein L40E